MMALWKAALKAAMTGSRTAVPMAAPTAAPTAVRWAAGLDWWEMTLVGCWAGRMVVSKAATRAFVSADAMVATTAVS
jgi:hypothetical protein